jgi:hypothetical protein
LEAFAADFRHQFLLKPLSPRYHHHPQLTESHGQLAPSGVAAPTSYSIFTYRPSWFQLQQHASARWACEAGWEG